MHRLALLAAAFFAFFATPLHAQTLQKTDTLLQYHTTVGTTAAAAIPTANVGGQVLGWNVCADSGNTSTLALGQLTDPSTDGMLLGAGACFACPNCTNRPLKTMRVKGGAASQGYSVVQFRSP